MTVIRTRTALLAGVATMSLTAAALASEFSNVIIFGDRFVDSGQYVDPDAVFPDGTNSRGDGRERFTNQLADGSEGFPWAPLVSRQLGHGLPAPSQPSIREGQQRPPAGQNFAAGFHFSDDIINSVNDRSVTSGVIYSSADDETATLAGTDRPGLLADPETAVLAKNSLVIMNGGSMDIRALANVERNLSEEVLVNRSSLFLDGEARNVIAMGAANNIANGALAMRDAGAGLVIVSNLMDQGALPESSADVRFAQQGIEQLDQRLEEARSNNPFFKESKEDAEAREMFATIVENPGLVAEFRTEGTNTFNARLAENLDGQNGVVIIDQNKLVAEMFEDPGRFGLNTSINHSVDCLNDGILDGCNEVSGPIEDRFHTTGLELTTVAHKMLAEQVVSVVNAPVQYSGIPLTTIGMGRDVESAGRAQVVPERIARRGWKPFVSFGVGQSTLTDVSGEGNHGAFNASAVGGVTYSLGNGVAIGVAGGYQDIAEGESDVAIDYEGSGVYGTVFAGVDVGRVFGTATATVGSIDLDRVSRTTRIGAATFENGGESSAEVFGASLEVGVRALTYGTVNVGPIASVDHWSSEVDGYNEDGSSATAVNYDDIDADSTRASLGIFLEAGDLADEDIPAAFRVKALYTREFDSDPITVSARTATSPNNTFTREGRGAREDSMTVGAQITYDFGPVVGSLRYDARIGEDDEHSGRIDFSIPFGG